MAGRREVRCVGPSYFLADRKSAVQRSVNLYLMAIEGAGEDSPFVLESAPGLEQLANLGAETQAIYEADGRLFVAAASKLYEWQAGAFVLRGDLGEGPVHMAHGMQQLCAVNGPDGWVMDLVANTLTRITAEGWRGSNRVDYIDGYFVFVDPGTDQFYISGIDAASELDALDFSSADAQPDDIVAQIVRKRELYLFGSRSCEVWINSGDPDFPLSRYQGTPIDVGVVGTFAVCKAADTLMFVGKTERGGAIVYEMNGYQPQRISTQSVEQALEASTDIAQATLWAYQEAGGEFVAVNAPGLETTWVFDAATRQWHERAELVAGNYQPLRVTGVAFHQNTHYAIAGTKFYRMARRINTLGGDVLCRERTWPHLLAPSLEPVTYQGLELRCTTGEFPGTAGITLEVSNDGGSVFHAPLRRALGAIGQRSQRVRWMPLGTARERVFRLRCTDAVPLTIHGATVEA
jgi:hypothetical protein